MIVKIIKSLCYNAFGLCVMLFLMLSCNDKPDYKADWYMNSAQQDSLTFVKYHHYGIGTNFILQEDSMVLLCEPQGWLYSMPFSRDSIVLRKGNDFVVTEIFKPSNYEELECDSVWLRVSADGTHLGWVSEKEMTKKSTPISPISQFIYFFSGSHLYLFSIIVVLCGIMVLYRRYKSKQIWRLQLEKINLAYPSAFFISISTAAMLYSSIQLFCPDEWMAYYYNPSLNPLGQPWMIFIFLCFAWLSILLAISVFYDLIEKVDYENVLYYMLVIVAWGCILYLALTLTISIYVGYILYGLYIVFVVKRYLMYKAEKKN